MINVRIMGGRGCGKSTQLVKAINDFIKNFSNQKIMVVTPTYYLSKVLIDKINFFDNNNKVYFTNPDTQTIMKLSHMKMDLIAVDDFEYVKTDQDLMDEIKMCMSTDTIFLTTETIKVK